MMAILSSFVVLATAEQFTEDGFTRSSPLTFTKSPQKSVLHHNGRHLRELLAEVATAVEPGLPPFAHTTSLCYCVAALVPVADEATSRHVMAPIVGRVTVFKVPVSILDCCTVETCKVVRC
jgi:hypothetical protein